MKLMETNRKLIKTLGKTEKLIKLKGRGPELPPPLPPEHLSILLVFQFFLGF